MLSVALLQIDLAFGNVQRNERHIKEVFSMLPAKQIDVIILPELWNTAYDLSRLSMIADEDGRKTKDFLRQLAIEHQATIIGGSVAVKRGTQFYNTQYIINPSGVITLEYSKVHLFRLMEEEKFFATGSKKGHVLVNGVDCASFICYDIRFPEWIRTHTKEGAKILFVAAEWPMSRLTHWRQLLIARAIENQCFVVACNRVGQDPNNRFAGHSMVIHPSGEIINEGSDQEEIIFAELPLDDIEAVRKQIPIFSDRRPELYE